MAYRTDLAVELADRLTPDKQRLFLRENRKIEGISVERVQISSEQGAAALGKPQGSYLTISLDALYRREEDAFARACSAFSACLRELLPESLASVLVIGLGNRSITPDAIGPRAADYVLATRHLKQHEPQIFSDWRQVSVFPTGVLGQTGIEAGEIVHAVAERIAPDAVIAIDALAAGRLSRLMRTVQLSDTGIVPGSGIGNARAALDRKTLGLPVIAVGVPTVVEGASIAAEVIDQLGGRDCEALRDLAQPAMVTTKEVDREVADLARLLGYGINMALHQGLSLSDIDQLVC